MLDVSNAMRISTRSSIETSEPSGGSGWIWWGNKKIRLDKWINKLNVYNEKIVWICKILKCFCETCFSSLEADVTI